MPTKRIYPGSEGDRTVGDLAGEEVGARAGRALHPVQRAQVAVRADVHVRAVGRVLWPLLPGPQLGGREPARQMSSCCNV